MAQSEKSGCMKICAASVGALLSIAYLANLGAGVVEVIPDNVPIVGNLDEIIASLILFSCLGVLGIKRSAQASKKMSNKTRLDNPH